MIWQLNPRNGEAETEELLGLLAGSIAKSVCSKFSDKTLAQAEEVVTYLAPTTLVDGRCTWLQTEGPDFGLRSLKTYMV